MWRFKMEMAVKILTVLKRSAQFRDVALLHRPPICCK